MDANLIEETVGLTQELVQIRSETPTGSEAAIADRIEDYLNGMGLSVERDPVQEDRENLVVELSGDSNRPALVFLNHMDTVPAGEGWTREPFSAEIAEGKMWGRGTCDMKGGLAAGLVALKWLKKRADQGARIQRSFRSCLVVDEESAWMRGAGAAVEKGRITKDDVVISCEPTSLELKTAQKGAMWYEVTFTGKSTHAAAPENGADAIQAAARMILLLQNRASKMDSSHPLLGKTTIVSSVIRGGTKTNIVADTCQVEVDVRFIPPLGVQDVRELILEAAEEASKNVLGTTSNIRVLSVDRPPILSDPNSEGAAIVGNVLQKTLGKNSEVSGVSYYSDAGLAAARTGNQQCFLLGPGNIAQAHGPDEYIEIEELKKATVTFGKLLEEFSLQE